MTEEEKDYPMKRKICLADEKKICCYRKKEVCNLKYGFCNYQGEVSVK
jgi:hypothetical protein